MSFELNLCSNGLFAVSLGYPVRLSNLGETSATGVIPKTGTTISATLYADTTADVHLALVEMPSTVGGPDGAIVSTTDETGTMTYYQSDLSIDHNTATVSITVPTLDQNEAAQAYVFRLWVDNFPTSTSGAYLTEVELT